MTNLRKILAAAVLLAGLSTAAQAVPTATTWTDEANGPITISDGGKHSYSHDLTKHGFQVGSALVTDFVLTIDLFDDASDKWYELESAFVDIPGVLGDRAVFNFGSAAYEGTSIAGVVELNLLGKLAVTITSIYGDFVFGHSKLVANGYGESVAGVPEPSTLSLLALMLVAVVIARRSLRREAASKNSA